MNGYKGILRTTPSIDKFVTIGSGTLQHVSTGAGPVNIYFRRYVMQMVYTKAEMNSAGVNSPVSITELGWFIVNLPIYSIPNYTIKIKHVTVSNVASALGTADWTTVKTISSFSPTTLNDWEMIEFDTPFEWNGEDNIGIELCWSQVQPTWNSSGVVRVISTTSGIRWSRADSAGTSCGLTPGSTSGYKPHIRFRLVSGDIGKPLPNNLSVLTFNGLVGSDLESIPFSVDDRIPYVDFQAWGSGGRGGSRDTNGTGGGGGGGAFASKLYDNPISNDVTFNFNISSTDGSLNSSFIEEVSSSTVKVIEAGKGNLVPLNTTTGGAGGIALIGDVLRNGGDGSDALALQGGGGGGGAGTNQNGSSSVNSASGGLGGNQFGGDGGGGVGVQANGDDGQNFGGGGGGARRASGGTLIGGAGGIGAIRVVFENILNLDPDANNFILNAKILDKKVVESINDLVIELKNEDLWDEINALYPFVGLDVVNKSNSGIPINILIDSYRLNLKDPRDTNDAFRLVFFGGYTLGNGFQPNGIDGYANTFYIPNSEEHRDDQHISIFSHTNNTPITTDSTDIGAFASTSAAVEMSLRGGTSFQNFRGAMNSWPGFNLTTFNNALGYSLLTRVSSTDLRIFRDGVERGSSTGELGSAVTTASVFIGNSSVGTAPYTNGWCNQRYGTVTIGKGLTSTQVNTLSRIVKNFENKVRYNLGETDTFSVSSWQETYNQPWMSGTFDGYGFNIGVGGPDAIAFRGVGQYLIIQFNFAPEKVEFLYNYNVDENNLLKLEESHNGVDWTVVADPIAQVPDENTVESREYSLLSTTRYLKWTQISFIPGSPILGNNRIDNLTVTKL